MNFRMARRCSTSGLDRAELFGLVVRGFQHFGQKLAERGVLGRRAFLQILAVNQRDVDGLADQIEQIFAA